MSKQKIACDDQMSEIMAVLFHQAEAHRLASLVDTMIAHVESRAQATGSAELACLAQQLKEIKECS